MKDLRLYLHDINSCRNLLELIKPMLKKGYEALIEQKPIMSMSGNVSTSYYLIIKRK